MKPMDASDVALQRLKAIADETRWEILTRLGPGECCVCELTEALDIAQPLLSFHLKVLKEAGLISDRREGRWSYYRLNGDVLLEIGESVSALSLARQPGRRRRTCR